MIHIDINELKDYYLDISNKQVQNTLNNPEQLPAPGQAHLSSSSTSFSVIFHSEHLVSTHTAYMIRHHNKLYNSFPTRHAAGEHPNGCSPAAASGSVR